MDNKPGKFSLDDLFAQGYTGDEIIKLREQFEVESGLLLNRGELANDSILAFEQQRNAQVKEPVPVAPVAQTEPVVAEEPVAQAEPVEPEQQEAKVDFSSTAAVNRLSNDGTHTLWKQGLDTRSKTYARAPMASWRDKLSAMWGQYTVAGNLSDLADTVENRSWQSVDPVVLNDISKMFREVNSGFDPDNSEGMWVTLLEEQERYGDGAMMLRAEQMREDLANNKTIDDMSWYAAFGYGAIAMAADPSTWAMGGVAGATTKLGASQLALLNKNILTASVRSTPAVKTAQQLAKGSTLETMSKWASIAGMESLGVNAPRLYGDVTYTIRDYKNDVMMETLFGGGLGLLVGKWASKNKQMGETIDARRRDLEQQVAAQKREVAGEKSNFDVEGLTGLKIHKIVPLQGNTKSVPVAKAVETAYNEQLVIKENMSKWNPNALRVSYEDFMSQAGGKSANTLKRLNDVVLATHMDRMNAADNTQKWLSEAVLDTMTQMNGRWLYTRSMLQESLEDVPDHWKNTDLTLDKNLERVWDDVNGDINAVLREFTGKQGQNPERIADGVQAMVHINDTMTALVDDTAELIWKNRQSDTFAGSTRVDLPEGGTRIEHVGELHDRMTYTNTAASVGDFSGVTLGVPLRSPVSLPNSVSPELQDLANSLSEIHSQRRTRMSKRMHDIINPNTKLFSDPMALRDVEGLTLKQLQTVIATVKNSALMKDRKFPGTGILAGLHRMNKILQVPRKYISISSQHALQGAPSKPSKATLDAIEKEVDDVIEAASKLALDYTVIAAYYSKGIPGHVAGKMKKVHFAERKVFMNNALDLALDTAEDGAVRSIESRVDVLKKYNNFMLQDEFVQKNARPMQLNELQSNHTHLMHKVDSERHDSAYANDDWNPDELDLELSDAPDLGMNTNDVGVNSQWDMLMTLNEQAIASGDERLLKEMHKLNGAMHQRMVQMELGTITDVAQPYMPPLLHSSEEAVKAAVSEGIPRFITTDGVREVNPAFKKRVRQLKQTPVKMDEETQRLYQEVLRDSLGTSGVDVLPRNIAYYQKDDVMKNITLESLVDMRSKLNKEVVHPLELYGKPSADYTRMKAIQSKARRLRARGASDIEDMIRTGNVGILSDTLAAAGTIRRNKQIQAKRMKEELQDVQRKQKIARMSDNLEKRDELLRVSYKNMQARTSELAEARARLVVANAERPGQNAVLMNDVVAAEDALMTASRELDDVNTVNVSMIQELNDLELSIKHDLKRVEESTPSAGGDNALNAGNMDSIKTGGGTPEKEIPDNIIRLSSASIAHRSHNKVMQQLMDFTDTELELAELATKPRTIGGHIGYQVGRAFGLTQDLATTFQKADSTVLKFVGHRITAMGKGHSGATKRVASGAEIREAEYTKSVMQMIPSYTKAIDAFAVKKGGGTLARIRAATESGESSADVDEFNRMFMGAMSDRRLGKATTPFTKEMEDFISDWKKYMDYNHSRLVDNDIQGFSADKRVDNYIPQIWQAARVKEAVQKNPLQVRQLFEKGYKNAGHTNAEELAQRQVTYLSGMSDDLDQFMPNIDGRAKHQIRIDQTAEVDGLSIMDLLDTEVAGIGMKYSNRIAGYVGLAKSSGGALTSQADIKSMRRILEQEVGQSENLGTALRDYDDVMDMMFGKPPRGGLPQWARSFKDLAVLTRMGGLGTAQAIETGTVITRGLLEAAGDPRFIKKLTTGLSEKEAGEDLTELMKLSGYNWEYEWLNRQSVHLDQEVTDSISKLKVAGNKLAEFATFGNGKAVASRLLSKTTGYNAIRKYQSAVVQRSFGFAVARHFKYGKSKMSHARMADLGISDGDGINVAMKDTIEKHVEFDVDGYPTKYNFDRWPVATREEFMYALQRAEAQDIQRGLVGELPRWMNSPAMQIAAQFRNMPLIANNKALARSLALGDKEAVVQLMLNTLFAGAVRSAKVAGLAGGYMVVNGTEFGDEFDKKWHDVGNDAQLPGAVDKYITQTGILADVTSLGVIAGQTWQSEDKNALDMLMGQVPMLSTMKSGYDTGTALGQGDANKALTEVQGYTPLGNTATMEWLFTWANNKARE